MKKKSTKLNYKSAIYLISAFVSLPVYAGPIKGIRASGATAGKTLSSVIVTDGKAKNENVEIKEGTGSESCKQDPEQSTYFPLDFFQNITREGTSLSFEQRPDNKILVKIPASIDTCGKFKPQLYQDPATKSVTVLMQLEDGKTYSQYISCLQEKKILKDGKIDHDSIEGKQYSEYSYVLDYNFSKNTDIKNTVKLSYGYPKAFKGKDGYPSSFGIDPDVELPSALCVVAEKIQPEITYINKGQDVLIKEINAVCESGDAQKIAESRKSIGNADALKDIAEKIKSELDAGYLIAIKKDVDKISAAMLLIENRLSNEQQTMDEITAKKEIKKYADLAKDLDTKFLNPAIYHLDTLMAKAAEMDQSDKNLPAILEEIKKLNEDIGAFAARKNAFSGIYSVMEKYAINNDAKTVEDIRLKSFWYGSVYPGPAEDKRGKPISFEEANKKQYAGLQKFERVLTDWNDQFLVGKGNLFPIKKVERERSAASEKMNKRWYDYQVDEQSKMQKYCGAGWTGAPKNPVQCQAFQSGSKKRLDIELARRRKDLLYIQGRDNKLGKMSSNYGEYQKRQVANDVNTRDDEPYGSSYTNYEDNFSDRFPGYYGSQTAIPYDPSMYNMGGQSSGNMGNGGNYNPNMVNAQIPVQSGQYQMSQWPSI